MLTLVAWNVDGGWESCPQLALTLDKFSNALMENLQRFVELGDRSGVETIWTCCVVCLGHLVALSHVTSLREQSSRGSMKDLCDLTPAKLAGLSRGVHVEFYSYLGVLTGVRISVGFYRTGEALTNGAHQTSWKRALDTIDVRIGLRSYAGY